MSPEYAAYAGTLLIEQMNVTASGMAIPFNSTKDRLDYIKVRRSPPSLPFPRRA